MSIEEYDGIMETVRNEIMEAIENLALMTQREFMNHEIRIERVEKKTGIS
jgi:hypothetical protein